MAEPKREQLNVKQQRAILVGVVNSESPILKEHALDELQGLVKTAGVKVVGSMVQIRERPHPATCLGSGKVLELKQLAESRDAELIIVDNNLTPAQGKNLEEATGHVVVDRSEVILDIFANHARTFEAKLQVELAQLLYFRTRLKRLWTHLERIEGGIGAGRGPGEKQLETDRRLIDKRIAKLRLSLEEIEKRREREVSCRNEQTTISLVGYTNAGKSTLMNALTGADVYIADKLFATLDTRTRKWSLPHWGDVLLSDTVGFVRNLPHHLVASFRSTLEEARRADLLLHVVDASHPEAQEQVHAVYEVLNDIGVSCENVVLVLNKLDAVDDRSLVDVLRIKYGNAVTISAKARTGLDRLRDLCTQKIGDGFVDAEIETSAGNGRLLAYLAQHGLVSDQRYEESNVTLRCRIPQRFFSTMPKGQKMTVRTFEAEPETTIPIS